MYQKIKITASANRSGAMDARDHFKTAMEPETIRLQSVAEVKNGESLKSHTSRENPKAMGI